MNENEIVIVNSVEPRKKDKKHRVLGVLLVICVLAAVSFAVIQTYPGTWAIMKKNCEVYNVQDLAGVDYSLYQKLMSEESVKLLSANEVFLPEVTAEMKQTEAYNDVSNFIESSMNNSNLILTKDYFNFCIRDLETNKIYENDTNNPLLKYLSGDYTEIKKSGKYVYLAVLKYDDKGNLTILYSSESNFSLENVLTFNSLKDNLYNFYEQYTDNYNTNTSYVLGPDNSITYDEQNSDNYNIVDTLTLTTPHNMQAVIAITNDYFLSSDYQSFLSNNNYWQNFLTYGFLFVLLIGLLIVIILALLLPYIKSLAIGDHIASKIPFELNVIAIIYLIFSISIGSHMAFRTVQGRLKQIILDYQFQDSTAGFLAYAINFCFWLLYFGAVFLVIVSLRQLFTLGLKRYFKEKVVCISIIRWFIKKIKILYQAFTTFDFNHPLNKVVLKIIAVNFVALFIMYTLLGLDIPGLIVYSMLLFYLIRKYLVETKNNHDELLQATRNMANGRLDLELNKDLGLFNPLKNELITIKDGFQKAVDEEVKSQQMKTELITNVSHDLKTPLTAIITYVDLLKDETITTEQRAEYIQTLDRKSLRLKKLIEDLFEVSKINSNNIELNLSSVDIISLIKQVQSELDDKINESTIQFKTNLPEEKVILSLDGSKTYRIFENLYINILKYAMPSTRAYIEVRNTPTEVIITLKNISNDELNFDKDAITERFVRGDKSRNTEGSGLGLAIVKSFVEIQGGRFDIEVDGDLYKAIVIFHK